MVNASGTITAQYVYEPYGVEEPWNTSSNPYRYTGRRLEPEWGIFHYRARYYDPALGRFLETDPVLYADQMNLYAYVGSNPLNMTDPTGQQSVGCEVCSASLARDGLNEEQIEVVQGMYSTLSIEGTHAALDVVGMTEPFGAVADVANAALYLAEGDFENASISGAALIPAVGSAATAGRLALNGADAARTTLRVGDHAGESIPARGSGRNFSSQERAEIDRIGRDSGCHTCGATDPGTTSGHHILDHQPVSSLNDSGSAQRLYPHSLNCSRRQGGEATAELARRRREPEGGE
ncbi:hypothetical protein L5876_03210 [Hyphobacterium sp. SN044]|uniref:RHS repeat-associated core domain-containing protein n=1 Tax=Hyphobacterium sp. SN044 TaxID=2912575 RepID=UPI001F419655|nr:RHS repeat-associated core domain-containing protein [Hyphobacterium sp. SN044]MCF8878820.1 hypothetical protein [Hyphobacterium sp. SN044]